MTSVPHPAHPALAVARRMDDIDAFYAMEIQRDAVELERAGRSIIYLCVGEPDFAAPPGVMDAADAAVRRGDTHYTVALGIAPLREAISGHYKRHYGLDIPPARIAVTSGASGALLIAFGTLVNPGDEWLMPDPTYPCNRRFVSLYGGTTRLIHCGPEENYQLTPELVEQHWGPNTRGVMLATPANPTGTTVAPAVMRAIHEVVRAKGGTLLVDEIYHGLTYERSADGVFANEKSALELGDDLIVVNSFSKYFNMTGWRLGWMVVPESHMKPVEKLAQNLYICPPTVSQYAALACFEPATLAIYEERRAEFARRRDFLIPALREIGFIIPNTPEGAFYVYADISNFGSDSFFFCRDVLHQAGVAITPGRDFGDRDAEKYVRFTYTVPIEQLQEVVARLRKFLGTRNK
ncbi:MAG TPA: pyridoxal phosphate-dependent aminotransferase [Burkholderiales bacterium]|nr:pyridoxal phosphate-dependent aminotransferase [Burkholderiales bacterium]